MKTRIQKSKKEGMTEGERYIGVLVERFEHKLDIVIDSQAIMQEDIKVLKSDVAVLKDDVAVLKVDVAVLKSDVAVLKDDVHELKLEMRDVKAYLMRIDEEIQELKHRLDGKADRERLQKLEREVEELKKIVFKK